MKDFYSNEFFYVPAAAKIHQFRIATDEAKAFFRAATEKKEILMPCVIEGLPYQSLHAAADHLSRTTDELLYHATEGRLELSIRIPARSTVWSMAEIEAEPWRYSADDFIEGVMDRLIDEARSVVLLNLSVPDCIAVRSSGTVEQGMFSSGYSLGAMEHLSRVAPQPTRSLSLLEEFFYSGWPRVFVLYPTDAPPPAGGTSLAKILPVVIGESDLFISTQELRRFRREIGGAMPADALDANLNLSTKVKILNEVAMEMWKQAENNDWLYPRTEVERVLRAKLSRNDIDIGPKPFAGAIRLIKPVLTKEGRIDLRAASSYKTRGLELLERAFRDCWSRAILAESDTHPKEERIKRWLKEKEDDRYSDRLAKTIALLIRPESIERGRQKKSRR